MTQSTTQPAASPVPAAAVASDVPGALRRLLLLGWLLAAVLAGGFLFLSGLLAPPELATLVRQPLAPGLVLVAGAFALWALPRSLKPLSAWAQGEAHPEAAVAALRRFPWSYWGTFTACAGLLAVTIATSARGGLLPEAADAVRITLATVGVSLLVAVPVFFRALELLGKAAAGLDLDRPVVGLRQRIFLLGALAPALSTALLLEYHTGPSASPSLQVWAVGLLLALPVGAATLLLAASLGRTLAPPLRLLRRDRPPAPGRLRARSTDELGVLTANVRALLETLHAQHAILALNNRLLRAAGSEIATADLLSAIAGLCREALGSDAAFVVLPEGGSGDLVAIAQAGAADHDAGPWRLSAGDPALRACLHAAETLVVSENAPEGCAAAPLLRALGARSVLATPIRGGDEPLGVVIAASRHQARTWSGRDIALIESLAREAALALTARRLQAARERAEAKSRHEAELARILMDATEQGISGADPKGHCLFVNRAALRMLGYAHPEELLGMNLHRLIHHSHPDGSPYPEEECRIRQASAAGLPVHSAEEVYWRRDGTPFPVEYWSHPIYHNGEWMGTVVSFLDVTARKQAEAAEARRQRMLQTLAAATDLMLRPSGAAQTMQQICDLVVEKGGFAMAWIGMASADRQVKPVARAGFEPGDLATADVRWDDTPHGHGPVGTAIREARTVVTDDTETDPGFAPWREKARRHRFRSVLATPVRMDGEVVGSIVIYAVQPQAFGIHEITLAQRLAADLGQTLARDAAEAALRASEARMEALLAERTREVQQQATIIDQIHDAVVSMDAEGVVTGWNAGAERLFGYRAQEVLGRSVALLHPDADVLWQDIVAPLRAHGAHEVEVSLRRKDGSLFDGHLSLSLLRDDAGTPVGMIGYVMDITERRAAERRLQARSEELAAINRELEAFSYSVSHDLRAPLRAIDGFSQALLEDYGERLDATGRDYLERVRSGAQRMARLIDDLLTLSRVSRTALGRAPVDLSALARDILAELGAATPHRRVEVRVAAGIIAQADPVLVRLALLNLLDNAWKYTRPRKDAMIEFGSHELGGERVYFVRDNGVGFDMQYANKLFGPFQRLHHPAEFEGTGIGLATVQRIIHRHGGRIWAEAEPGRGATFRFTLGIAAGEEGSAQ